MTDDAARLVELVDRRYQREIETAAALALEAGAAVMRHYHAPLAVETKDDQSPVTAADREASILIVEGLAQIFAGDAILSEEDEDDAGRRLASERVWMVDPLDGTKDFVAGRAGFSIMIGLVEGDRPRLGVVMHPAASRLYLGVVGAGAWMIDGRGEPQPMRVSPDAALGAIRLVASKSHRSDDIDRIKAAIGVSDEVNIGSVGVKCALIASGVRDLYVNPARRSKLWDACAPEALLCAAGGRVTDLYGDPIAYRRAELGLTEGMVASSGAIHDAVLERLAPLFPRP